MTHPATVPAYPVNGGLCPHCGKMPSQWTAGEIITAIVRWAAEHDGLPPRSTDWLKASSNWPAAMTVIRMFGSWGAAVHAAGSAVPRPRKLGRTRREIADALTDWRFENGKWPTAAEWDAAAGRCGLPARQTVAREFGTWNRALRYAGAPKVHERRGPRIVLNGLATTREYATEGERAEARRQTWRESKRRRAGGVRSGASTTGARREAAPDLTPPATTNLSAPAAKAESSNP